VLGYVGFEFHAQVSRRILEMERQLIEFW